LVIGKEQKNNHTMKKQLLILGALIFGSIISSC